MADAVITPVSQATATSGVGPQSPGTPEPGVLLSGTIIGRDANGNFLLKTANGNLSLQSSLPLTYNSDVVIRMEAGGGQASASSAKIVSVNGEPFAEFVQPGQPEEDSVSSALLSQTPETLPAESSTLPASPSVRAVVVSAPPSTALAPDNAVQSLTTGNEPALTNGTEVIIHLPETAESSALAPSSPAATATAPQPASTQPDTPAPPTITQINTPQPIATPPATAETKTQPTDASLQPLPVSQPASTEETNTQNLPQPTADTATSTSQQTTLPPTPQSAQNSPYAAYSRQSSLLNFATSQPQNSANSAPANTPQAKTATIQGQIVSTAKDGTIIIQTQAGAVTLKSASLPESAALTSGSDVVIEVPDNASLVASPLPLEISSLPAPLAEMAASWNTLKDIASIINDNTATRQSSGAQANNSLLARLPTLDTDFLSSSLSFITALANGDIRKILGDDVINTLRQNGRMDLLQKFTGELATVSGSFNLRTGQPIPSWQATFLPFVYGGEMQQARLYIKRDAPNKKQQGGGSAGNGTRFVVEVNLSEFGGMQMDGLIRKMQAGTLFDLMIRSNTGFSRQEQADIISIYHNAAEQTGFSGTLSFQVTNDFPVKPLDDLLADQTNSITA